jgi:hypothetical protein
MNKTLENLKETLEDEIKAIIKKGDMTPSELESVQKAVCTIDMIEKMERGGHSEGMMMDGYSNRHMPYRHMPSYGSYNDRSYGDEYGDHSGRRYYHDSYGYDESYHGDSYRRGRSPVTGRYISRGEDHMSYRDGYSGHSIKDRMVAQLENMYDQAKSEHERQIVDEWIKRLEGGK